MNRKEARESLRQVLLHQKTVNVSKLKTIIDALEIDRWERERIGQANTIARQRKRLNMLETKNREVSE